MKLLVVCPDYASHAIPMIEVARAWAAHHGDVVVATGEATRPLVEAAGCAWTELRLGAGSNSGVIEATDQPVGEDDHLRAFFDATRAGPVATLVYQADARRRDLLHEPDRVMDRLDALLREVQPDRIVVDHVAFGARLALHALGATPATVVLGHPSALSAPGEVYGAPPEWPASMRPSTTELTLIDEHCRASLLDLRTGSRALLARRSPGSRLFDDPTATPGTPTIYVYPAALHDPSRALPSQHVFIGSMARTEELGDVELPTGTGLRVTVALGSFLSARDDVLAVAVRAAHLGGWRLALASGSSDPTMLGPLPDGALMARHLPQVALLAHTDVLVTHGGNGSVTEAVSAGVPMVVLPFSTDQFAGAASIERAGIGRVLAPNDLRAEDLVAAVDAVHRSPAPGRVAAIARQIARRGGAAMAADALARPTD